MLKFKVKLRESKKFSKIDCDNLFLSPNLDFISGYTNSDNCLVNGQKLMIRTNNLLEIDDNDLDNEKTEIDSDQSYIEVTANTEDVIRQGEAMYEQDYNVEDYIDDNGSNYKCVRYIDGKYYFSNKINTEDDEKIEIEIGDNKCEVINNNIKIPTKYYIENNKLTIGDFTYNLDIALKKVKVNDDEFSYEKLNDISVKLKDGTELHEKKENDREYIEIYPRNKWKNKTKFILQKSDNFKINIDYASFTDKKYYFEYGTKNNSMIKNYFNLNSSNELLTTTNDGKEFRLLLSAENDNDNKIYPRIENTNNGVNNVETYFNIKFDWVNVSRSKYITLYADNSSYKFKSSQKILVKSTDKIWCRCEETVHNENEKYFLYGGKKYTESNDYVKFAVINNNEYQIYETDNKNGYFYMKFFNEPTLIEIEDGENPKFTIVSDVKNKKYDIKKYKYITINNTKFFIKNYDKVINDKKESIKYVDINLIENYILNIDNVISGSMLLCHPDIEDTDNMEVVCSRIIGNISRYSFQLINELFTPYNISKEGFFNEKYKGNKLDDIEIDNFTTLMNIPLVVENEYANNLNQDDIVQNYFTKKEIEKSINPYVDMEREIYYPCYIEDYSLNNKDFTTVNEIEYNLHFRSRNMDDWKINEDIYSGINFEKGKEPKCNWNFFDYYTNEKIDGDDRLLVDNTKYSKYHQPSDLLYFLNFSTDDVFYQKSKLGMSFLRLSFFNTNNPTNQTLLYTCTIFLDDKKLYKKYIDSVSLKKTKYRSINSLKNSDGDIFVTNQIGTDFDTCEDNNSSDAEPKVTFEEDYRLSATFNVKNRYESEESSEGFYLYIFKDYCERLHEEPIYMKIDFNHAGEGRTVNMVVPFKIGKKEGSNEEEYTLLNLKDESDIKILKDGIPLDELFKHIYLPLESVYDDVNRRYCYYLPKWLKEAFYIDKNKIQFNLYELKIKDESKKMENS